MTADTSKIKVVCPTCYNNMEIPGEKKNTLIECPKCGNAFMAYEAMKCDKCGGFRHPNHKCRNCMTKFSWADDAGKKTSFSWSDLWSGSRQNDELARRQREQEEQKVRELFDKLPEDIRAALEFEAKKNAERFEEMSERIDELEDRLAALESELEELKEKEDE